MPSERFAGLLRACPFTQACRIHDLDPKWVLAMLTYIVKN
ncbi:hypothetical protein [Azospirillum doebereinerae]